VTSGEDILQEVGIVGSVTRVVSTFTADSPEEQSVFDALTSLPSALDDLVVKTKLNAAVLNGVLTVLELKGVVKNAGGGRWVRA
jgi:predicted Rossmann fold nucleotide-binding protein DprA/Smf involved in DNA uptake